jgi:D-galactarolactone cycloisomerase
MTSKGGLAASLLFCAVDGVNWRRKLAAKRGEASMKIVAVESILLAIPFEDRGGVWKFGKDRQAFQTLLLRIDTDQGVSGWGEVFTKNGELALKAMVDTHVAPLLIGRDATQIAQIKLDLEKALHNFGRIGPLAYAISGVDLALWDILGRAAGLPLHRLLGGACRETVDCYASLTRYGGPKQAAKAVERAAREGYGAVKLHEVLPSTVGASRKAVGPDVKLMIDTNCPWTLGQAKRALEEMAPHDLFWLEEPVWPPENYEALAELRDMGLAPIAAGENAGGLMDYLAMFEAGAVDIVQPDIAKSFGLSEAIKIAALAEAFNVELYPHCFMIGPGYAATLHLCAALPHRPMLERFFIELAGEPMGEAVAPRKGVATVPQGPGLGCEPDPKLVKKYRLGPPNPIRG